MNKRRRLTGIVKSNKMDKTVIVDVTRTFQHHLYHKVVREVKSYKAHDELGCNVGDKVIIVESAPYSKTVRWNVEKIAKVEFRLDSIEAVEEAIAKAEELAAEEAADLAEEAAETIEEVAEAVEEAVEVAEEIIDGEEGAE
jgi:small subunit ribosomal protein S17